MFIQIVSKTNFIVRLFYTVTSKISRKISDRHRWDSFSTVFAERRRSIQIGSLASFRSSFSTRSDCDETFFNPCRCNVYMDIDWPREFLSSFVVGRCGWSSSITEAIVAEGRMITDGLFNPLVVGELGPWKNKKGELFSDLMYSFEWENQLENRWMVKFVIFSSVYCSSNHLDFNFTVK